ncbi:hypothetical protein [Bacillus cereus]|uniref:hypothetical protein n=1 Tax=Bacillus cereus TaxID=1396 RepID=UPI000BEDE9C6|nr:hypothetical protein [Bacillus cereus]PEE40168.1 hypothetical protein CON59_00870 [Bacillus cereus]PET53126.1 hypothetical protein CN523_00980 [Bacillus cereus]PEV85541.1 hypothetical protein CN429_06460 [Bacillus cereus]PFA60364.1 hypothetical protein CN389_02025 [Bacillus cereus]PFD67282.1 hypothetical protein CN271_21570 [Bacillus cereus]
MIISVDTGKIKTKLPYQKEYEKWKVNLSSEDLDRITYVLNQMINEDEIHTSGWMPSSNWIGTVIYHACNRNQTQAALFFGLIVYKVFMDREEIWACGKFDLHGKNIKSLTYFRVSP